MIRKFESLNASQRGAIFIVLGAILFFYAIGFFRQALHLIVIMGSLLLIFYGIFLGDYWTKATNYLKSFKK